MNVACLNYCYFWLKSSIEKLLFLFILELYSS